MNRPCSICSASATRIRALKPAGRAGESSFVPGESRRLPSLRKDHDRRPVGQTDVGQRDLTGIWRDDYNVESVRLPDPGRLRLIFT
jgi:hypothetical protein